MSSIDASFIMRNESPEPKLKQDTKSPDRHDKMR